MPRVGHHARSGAPLRRLRRSVDRLPVLRAAADRRAGRTWARHRATATRGGWSPRSCFEVPVLRRLRLLFRTVFVRGGRSDRLARELPDHDGRAGRHAPVRGGRRGRHRAHRVGAAALGHGARAMVAVPDGRLPRPALRASTWPRSSSSGSGCYVGVFAGPAPFAITVVPAIFARHRDRRRSWPSRCCPATPSGASQRWAGAARARRAHAWRRLSTIPAAAAAGVRDRDRARARPRGRACSARSPGGASTSPTLWACFHAFGDAPPFAVIVHGLLRRHARPTRCRCPAASAASTAA